jgi:GSH-dependent disulfide-bond oxidoreductase
MDLYGDATGNVLRVAIALEEAGLSYRPVRVELKDGAQRSEVYPRLNPVGRILVAVDSDGPGGRPLVLTQSNAISFYIADISARFCRIKARRGSRFGMAVSLRHCHRR